MGAAKACNSPYESARNQRVQENKKRLQELGLTDLSKDLTNSAIPTKSSPVPNPRQGKRCVEKEKVKVQLRRSTRHSGGPQPDYVEVEIDVRRRVRFDNTGGTRHYSRLFERKYASDEARSNATDKAEALKKELPQMNASFVKPMLQSHVTGGFWLGLPVAFCRDYLPKKDERIVLEDENNEEWETIYLSNKTGLSGGWRGFSLDHGLVDGDALVFELVEPRRFKVHIIRVYGNDSSNNKEGEELEEDAEKQGLNGAETGNPNKVRQRLIWETVCEEDNDMKGKSDDVDFDMKPYVPNSIVKEEVECNAGIDDAKNVNLLDTEADDDRKGPASFKRLKRNADLHTITTVKEEMQTYDADDGSTDVKAVPLLHINGSSKHAKDITSYMRSKKHLDVNVKKEVQAGNRGIEAL